VSTRDRIGRSERAIDRVVVALALPDREPSGPRGPRPPSDLVVAFRKLSAEIEAKPRVRLSAEEIDRRVDTARLAWASRRTETDDPLRDAFSRLLDEPRARDFEDAGSYAAAVRAQIERQNAGGPS
jgi:hypothetical protein